MRIGVDKLKLSKREREKQNQWLEQNEVEIGAKVLTHELLSTQKCGLETQGGLWW